MAHIVISVYGMLYSMILLPSIILGQLGGPLSYPHDGGSYCKSKFQPPCCKGRQDECSVPRMQTLCYCDEFCVRGNNGDCCPDYRQHCLGETPSEIKSCYFDGKYYQLKATETFNCYQCTCEIVGPSTPAMKCNETPCLIQPDAIESINGGRYGWRASNYSFFWGKTLEEGYRTRAGVCKPEIPVLEQTSIHKTHHVVLEESFDTRQKWPGLIQPISDQKDFPASWAISTADVASDRLAIQTMGQDRTRLSAQNLISCIATHNGHCSSGSTDRAWWYLKTFGVVAEQCYPYTSGFTKEKGSCEHPKSRTDKTAKCQTSGDEGMLYRSPPAYRLRSDEVDIMAEIQANGPVQAFLHVQSDFFMYKSGIYQTVRPHSSIDHHQNNSHHLLAVRIVGWGVDTTDGQYLKYWTCANSWGTDWGEDGYFRIVRGRDECDIEMFVIGVWANAHYSNGVHQNLLSNNI